MSNLPSEPIRVFISLSVEFSSLIIGSVENYTKYNKLIVFQLKQMLDITSLKNSISPKPLHCFRIVSYNIAHGRARSFHQLFLSKNRIEKNCSEIANLLKNTEADLVFLQEIDFNAFWTKYLNHTEIINKIACFPFAHNGVHNQSNLLGNLNYGNAILSKHEMHDYFHHTFEKKMLGSKGFQKAIIHWQNKNISVINTHLHPFSNKKREAQLNKLGEILSNTPKPYLLGGDFNMSIDNSLLQNFIREYKLSSPPQTSHTYQYWHWKKQLDFIFGSDDFLWQNAEVINTNLSDHFPLIQDFKFR